nr:formylglycine-generating enzyme family protein [uncultured Undibacterium sp.]
MTLVPAGSFDMGSPESEDGRYGSEGPLHKVQVAQFYMGKYEVTRAQFAVFVAATDHDTGQRCSTSEGGKMAVRDGRSWRNPGYAQTDDDPVVCVNWDDAQAYANWLSKQTGLQYTLPSEAQWEYATRAGRQAARPWGERADDACQYANVMDATGKAQVAGITWAAHGCDDGYAYSAPVGSFKPNGFGLHDMIGNVWEWAADCWNKSYQGAPSDGSASTSGNCTRRANRGGGWYGEARDARSAYRDTLTADTRDANLGFRLARAAKTL